MIPLVVLYYTPTINKATQLGLKYFKKDKEVVDATSVGGLDKKTSEEVVKKSVNIINDMFDNFKYSVIKKNSSKIFDQNNNIDKNIHDKSIDLLIS